MQKYSEPPPHYYGRSLPWSTVIKILEKLRIESHLNHTYFDHEKVRRKDERIQRAIAGTLQKFLLLSFFVLNPPDRQRTVRELELGRTLKHGIFLGDAFIPLDKMEDPSQAKFYTADCG